MRVGVAVFVCVFSGCLCLWVCLCLSVFVYVCFFFWCDQELEDDAEYAEIKTDVVEECQQYGNVK